jgi:hypothetical protein
VELKFIWVAKEIVGRSPTAKKRKKVEIAVREWLRVGIFGFYSDGVFELVPR